MDYETLYFELLEDVSEVLRNGLRQKQKWKN